MSEDDQMTHLKGNDLEKIEEYSNYDDIVSSEEDEFSINYQNGEEESLLVNMLANMKERNMQIPRPSFIRGLNSRIVPNE